MDFKQKPQLYKFYVNIQVSIYDMDPNSYLNDSGKTPPL